MEANVGENFTKKNLVEYAYYGIEENIRADETVQVSLRDLMKVNATLAELVQFFHQPMHFQSLEDVNEYLGNRDSMGGFTLLCLANYEVMGRMLPEKMLEMYSEGVFDNPQKPYYFEPKD